MRDLVLQSSLEPEKYSLLVKHEGNSVYLRVNHPNAMKGLTLSIDDARKLRDFLNNRLGEQAPEPMGSGRWVYLDEDSHGEDFWCQFPTMEKARDYAKFRTGRGMKNQMIARCHQTLVPVTVTTTSYEWKDIG
jgi:hypothetical protein